MIYKEFLDLKLSEIGIGTYLGGTSEEKDQEYYSTIKEGINNGINVIDTAINYRNMRSERVIGKVLSEIERKILVISTKGGYIPVDDKFSNDSQKWFKEELLDKEIISKKELNPYGNIISRKYIDWSFNKSLENLNTEYIDIYFLHNPEDQLNFVSKEEFYEKLADTFDYLEGKVREKN